MAAAYRLCHEACIYLCFFSFCFLFQTLAWPGHAFPDSLGFLSLKPLPFYMQLLTEHYC